VSVDVTVETVIHLRRATRKDLACRKGLLERAGA
jgi:hypothetical protein